MRGLRFAWVPAAAGLLAVAWSGHEVTEDGLRLAIGDLAPVADPASPSDVVLTVSNGCAGEFRGTVSLRNFVDDWKAIGPASIPVRSETPPSTTRGGPSRFWSRDAARRLHGNSTRPPCKPPRRLSGRPSPS